MKIALLTSRNMAVLLPYDIDLLAQLNNKAGIEAFSIVWEDVSDSLNSFDAAIFRTTWGYHENIAQFKLFLDKLDSLNIKVLNPTSVIKANLDKSYLIEIASKGVNIIPTLFVDKYSSIDLASVLTERNWKQFIIKPQISAGSYQTHLFSHNDVEAAKLTLSDLVKSGDVLLQEFIPAVKTDGEFSTIFFNRDTHYTVNKIPKAGDYRVQYQFGGQYKRVQPNEIIMSRTLEAAELFIDSCLYVRVDGLFFNNDFYIMEVELIEPDLYLNLVPEYIPKLADEIIKRLS